MSSLFRPTTKADEPALVEFLTRVFGATSDAPFVNSALLHWKYWDERADYSEPRSVIIDRDGAIAAHAGLWPVSVEMNGTMEHGVHMIDWASDPKMPGAGVSLVQRLTKNYDFVFAIGGSELTQSVLPKFGFETVATASTFARPLRPWRQIVRHQTRDLRLPVRLARNFLWSTMPIRKPMPGWTSVEATASDAAALSRESGVSGAREPGFFTYLQQCPTARIRSFHVMSQGKKAGLFTLSETGDQVRLAGAWLDAPRAESWRILFNLAQDASLRHTRASELVARDASDAFASGAAEAGLRVRAKERVFVFRKRGGALPIRYQMCDDDAVFLGEPRGGFFT